MKTKIRITDTTLRDAHQSLWATRMRTDDILKIAERAKKAKKWSPRIKGGWLERYSQFVGNASTGASLKR